MKTSKNPKPDGGNSFSLLHDNTAAPRDGRRARGLVFRDAVPFQSLAGWAPDPLRPDPIEVLKNSDRGRIPNLLPIRYGRMLKTPFTFYRGAADVMARDLATTPVTGIRVQLCGDCHALNFGAFATPERNVSFDIVDFDETLPGPWEWDLKRLTTSLVLLARDNGIKLGDAAAAAEAAARTYREKMLEFASMSILDVWYAHFDWENVVTQASDQCLKKNLEEHLKKAQKRSIQHYYFPKLTHSQNGKQVITDDPPLIYHPKDDKDFVSRMNMGLQLYRNSLQGDKRRLIDRFQLCDIAIKVVGVGSVGTSCAIALYMGPNDEPLFLQLKEARESVLEKHAGKSSFESHGRRVVEGQRIIQSASDIFLGWFNFDDGKHYYVRQLRDTKVKLISYQWAGPHLIDMSGIMGAVLARAHARSGDSAMISGYLGQSIEFDRAIADFSTSYADQVEKDHAVLVAAVHAGRIRAETDVQLL
jgi:uncharacterized protein (DUF2252 family)